MRFNSLSPILGRSNKGQKLQVPSSRIYLGCEARSKLSVPQAAFITGFTLQGSV